MGSSSASVSLTSPMASTESSPAPTTSSGTPARIEVIEVGDDADEDNLPPAKRHKNLTSDVWTGNHYDLYDVVEEIDGKKVRVQWASCKRCIYTKDWVGSSRKDKKRKVESILKDLEVAEMVAASITMEDLEEQKQMSSDDED